MKLLSVVGARPQFVKIAPLANAIERRRQHDSPRIEHLLLHTGQHYDAAMSDVFFTELKLPQADFNLGVGSGQHGSQTGQMLAEIERVLLEVRPDLVAVYGDTNSTLAGALAGVKLHIPVAHVEAGLRSFNRKMPEEINRVAADHVCDLLLAPTSLAMKNLATEALAARSEFTGDIMYDAVLHYRQVAERQSRIGKQLALEIGAYAVVTVHRAENTDDIDRLADLLTLLNKVADDGLQLVFPLHPRTAQRIRSQLGHWQPHQRLHLIDPVGYLDMLWLVGHAVMAITDSGGLQKEAFFLGTPCITLRDETEWVETVDAGGNVLTGNDAEKIFAAVAHWQRFRAKQDTASSWQVAESFGNGDAADRILDALRNFVQTRASDLPRSGIEQGAARTEKILPAHRHRPYEG